MNATMALAAAADLPAPQGSALPQGTARVSALVAAAKEAVWTALTERDTVGRWFGNLSETLAPGGVYRLDFGDGDFFEIDDVHADPPRRLGYRWRFLGTGPQDRIAWSIEPEGDYCRVTVTDCEPNRSAAGIAEMIEGWTDFLGRLQSFCATGKNTRYSWRKEFGGAIELPTDASTAFGRLLSAEGQRRWLPWSAGAITSGTPATMNDDGKPARFTIGDVRWNGQNSVQFSLSCPEWLAPTQCAIEIQSWPRGALLVVAHTGWQTISQRDADQATQRLRFSTLWTQSLHAAQQFAAA